MRFSGIGISSRSVVDDGFFSRTIDYMEMF